ncbi:chemotaxis protein CheB, partial [Vibrio parahaemolyticus]
KALREVGGRTLAEDESTCVIFGMPKAAQEIGAVEKMVPIHLMAQAIAQAVGEAPLRRAS